MSEIANRLVKNKKKLKGWLKSANITAFRLYDWDIPGYPFFIDVYGDHFVIYDKTDSRDEDRHEQICREISDTLHTRLDVPEDKIIWKVRERQKGRNQYQPLGKQGLEVVVREGSRKYLTNLTDYLDCGLFLDHRPIRDHFQKNNQGEFLNLFSYTCSVGLAAALGGAKTTNVDLSKTYLDWGESNYRINDLDPGQHRFLHGDVLEWLEKKGSLFHSIFLDPPTFSNSKRMKDASFDVQRDQLRLMKGCLDRLEPGGVLYFSNNASKFRLDAGLKQALDEDLTDWSHPKDSHNRRTHVCFRFTREGLEKAGIFS